MTSRQISELRKISELQKSIYLDSLRDKIANDSNQFMLKQTFKPILSAQESQLNETKNIVKTQDQKQIVDQQKHQELIDEIKIQPLLIPLIKSLKDYPDVINVITGVGNVDLLSDKEKQVLKELGNVDNNTLRVLIRYYLAEQKTEEKVESTPNKYFEEAKNVFDNIQKHDGNEEKIRDILNTHYPEFNVDGAELLVKYVIANSIIIKEHEKPWNLIREIRPDVIVRIESNDILDDSQIEEAINKDKEYRYVATRDVVFTGFNKTRIHDSKDAKEYIDNYFPEFQVTAKDLMKEYIKINKTRGISRITPPWSYLSVEDYNMITGRRVGKGISFLSSDPKELFKKLNILIAEKDAGHTNILTEATAIVDELRRSGLLTINQVKKIYKLIV